MTRKRAVPMGELVLIDHIRREFSGSSHRRVRLGIGDDCAILRPAAGSEVLVTTDFCLEGRHFRRDWHSPESVGHRCLARGLSDLAAMGASPMAAFLSLALPIGISKGWVERFFEGLKGLADQYSVPLAGGDTAESPADLILADIVLIGAAPAGRALRRSGARIGDRLYVSGQLGGSAAELQAMRGKKVRRLKKGHWVEHPQMFPEPRLAVGQALLKKGLATACLDLSDGLSTDLAHLCEASGVGAEVFGEELPIHPLAAKLEPEQAMQAALHGGEDYELMFTVSAAAHIPRQIGGVALQQIGTITNRRKGITLMQACGRRTKLAPGGWEHFKSRPDLRK